MSQAQDGGDIVAELREAGAEIGETLQSAPASGRRAFLAALAGAVGVQAMSDTVAAQSAPSDAACEWRAHNDANGFWILDSGGIEFEDGSTITSAGGKGSVLNQVDSGTVTATGGASPAVEAHLDNVSDEQLLDYFVLVYVDQDPGLSVDYAFNFDYVHYWDETNATLDMDLVVNWDVDPGGGNDVTLRWEVLN